MFVIGVFFIGLISGICIGNSTLRMSIGRWICNRKNRNAYNDVCDKCGRGVSHIHK